MRKLFSQMTTLCLVFVMCLAFSICIHAQGTTAETTTETTTQTKPEVKPAPAVPTVT